MTNLLKSGRTDTEIIKFLEENHSISVPSQNLDQCNEDWGLTLHASHQIEKLEGQSKTYFNQELAYSKSIILSPPATTIHTQNGL